MHWLFKLDTVRWRGAGVLQNYLRMLQCVIVNCVISQTPTRMLTTGCLEGQDLPCIYLAHHELESVETNFTSGS